MFWYPKKEIAHVGLGVLGNFFSKKSGKKSWFLKISKLHQVYVYFFVPNCSNIFNICKHFWIYIFWEKMSQKYQIRKNLNCNQSSCTIFCFKVTRYSQRFLNCIKSLCDKCFNASILYTTDIYYSILLYTTMLLIILFDFFNLLPCKNSTILCHAIGINSSLIFFRVLCVF